MSTKSKTVYAVYRKGTYRHECCGIYSDSERAIRAAQFFAKSDTDSHHSYQVVPNILNNVPGIRPTDPMLYASPEIVEADPIYTCQLKDFT